MADIRHEVKIEAPQERVFEALSTIAGLNGWHSANTAGGAAAGEVIVVQSQRGPAFEWKVTKAEKPSRVEWKCVKGPGNSEGTTARFDLTPSPDGRTFLEFSHSDWPDTSGNFRKCNTLWGILLYHLKRYSETQKVEPAF